MGKQVLTVDDVLKVAESADKVLQCKSSDCIITPGAMDKIEELGVRFMDQAASPQPSSCTSPEQPPTSSAPSPTVQSITDHIASLVKDQLPSANQAETTQLIQKIVAEKLATPAAAPAASQTTQTPVEQSGVVTMAGNVSLIDSSKVFAKEAKIDLPGKVSISDAIRSHPESSHATTYMQWEKSSIDRTLEAPEINLVVEGELEITVDGKVLKAQPGDIFFMTKGASVTYNSPSSVKLACVNV